MHPGRLTRPNTYWSSPSTAGKPPTPTRWSRRVQPLRNATARVYNIQGTRSTNETNTQVRLNARSGPPAVIQKTKFLPNEVPTARQCEEFDAIWFEYRKQLQLSKEVAAAIALQVRQGRLPCDAGVLRERMEALLHLGSRWPDLKPRQLIAENLATLRYPPQVLARAVRRVHALLPDEDLSSVMLTIMGELHQPVEVLALQFVELGLVFNEVFGTANIPAKAFSYAMRNGQPGRALQQAQLQGLVDVLGREAAYVAIKRLPALVAIDTGVVQSRCDALQQLLGVERLAVVRMVELRGDVLSAEPAMLAERFRGLTLALGWRRRSVAQLAATEPLALLREPSEVVGRVQRAQAAAMLRPLWRDEMDAEPVAIATLLLKRDLEVLDRLDYLVSSRERRNVTLKQVLLETKGAFLKVCPRYRQWRLGGTNVHGPTVPVTAASSFTFKQQAATWKQPRQQQQRRLS